jgi:uncharacterized membrane protein (Fun14 family)
LWAWLARETERFVLRFGLYRPFVAIGTLLGALAAFGLKAPAAWVAALIGLFTLLVLTVFAQAIDRRRLGNLLVTNAGIMDRYANELKQRQHSASFDIVDWIEKQHVGKFGDSVIEQWLTLRVGNEPLPTCWILLYKAPQSPDEKASYRKKVRFEAAEFLEGGDVGVSLPITHRWQQDKVRIFAHFQTAFPPGEIVRIRFRSVWPTHAEALVSGSAVLPIEWRFHRACEHLQYSMTLDKSSQVAGPLRITPHHGSPMPRQQLTDGVLKVEFEIDNPRPEVLIGFRVQQPDV